jgi:AcrR family transcriptional regulator
MPRDANATRARILDAAIEEFAQHGLAGARIDRIAEAAEANKRSIYVYFESKEGLFGAALLRAMQELSESVPLTENDLPGYAGRFFDELLAHPQALRLSLWRMLERPGIGPDMSDVYARKVAAMTRPDDGAVLPAADLVVLIHGLALGWLVSPEDLLSADGSDPRSSERIAQHRAALVEAARRLSDPGATYGK